MNDYTSLAIGTTAGLIVFIATLLHMKQKEKARNQQKPTVPTAR